MIVTEDKPWGLLHWQTPFLCRKIGPSEQSSRQGDGWVLTRGRDGKGRIQRVNAFQIYSSKKKKKKKLGRGKTYRFYIQGISFQGGWHFCDFFLQSLERERAETGFELKRDTALFQHISESIQPFLESDTYQPQSGCKVFDFLVDEAAELELAFLALDWLLILRLCAFHTEQES